MEKNPFSILNKGEVYIILSYIICLMLKTVNAEIHPKTHFPL